MITRKLARLHHNGHADSAVKVFQVVVLGVK